MKALLTVEIPKYPTRVMLNRSRPAVYYTRNTRIPKKYKNSDYDFNAYGVLIESRTNTPVVANPQTANTPKYKKINGRDFLSGKISPATRSYMFNEMKRFFLPFFQKKKKIYEPCHVKIELSNTLEEAKQDLDNMSWILVKVILDVLVESDVLPKNNVHFVQGFEVTFKPVNDADQRKLTVSVYALSAHAVSVLSY